MEIEQYISSRQSFATKEGVDGDRISRTHAFPWMAKARSLVMIPSSPMLCTQAASSEVQNCSREVLESSLARKASPRVQAKMEATGLVEVSFPEKSERDQESV